MLRNGEELNEPQEGERWKEAGKCVGRALEHHARLFEAARGQRSKNEKESRGKNHGTTTRCILPKA